jgi:hypothetical protein
MRDRADTPALSSAAIRLLREDQPSDRELAAAYRRFAQKPQRGRPRFLVSRWLIAGLAMGLGVAFGAESVVERLHPTPPARSTPPLVVPHVKRKATPRTSSLPSREDTLEPAVDPMPASSQAQPPPVANPANARSRAPDVHEHAPDVDEHPAANSSLWAKAAQGLRDDDFAGTEAALGKLEQAGSETDREAARLIRAQLLLHQGNASGARALLQDLASNAQSAQVRAKARGLLSESALKSNSPLNGVPSGT